ncbi:type III-B CRISPR module-associated Cmr3 family protein [Halomonas sp.]|uniref:type III-B CRISPR module-associated Cmr3 family protein n=1 Tax=Halomonas sp. TaxID=1486246 RepID=UPI003850141D
MSQSLSCWQFHAVDSWFFRETRAHDAVGVSELGSVFPPPVRTLMGAVRTCIGDRLGVDWHAFAEGTSPPEQQALLGDAEQLGQLEVRTVILRHRGETLWPCPADLMVSGEGESTTITRLRPGSAVECDLGRVALPAIAKETPAGSKVPESAWLTDEGAQAWLMGEVPQANQLVKLNDLLVEEPRLGIGRDNGTATVRQGLLYQTRHLRIKDPDTHLELWLSGVPSEVLSQLSGPQSLRLGGEGRLAEVNISDVAAFADDNKPFPTHSKPTDGRQLALWLTAPAAIDEQDAVAGLPGFAPITTDQGVDVWEGTLHGVTLRLVSSCRPRAYREGGWDQRQHRPLAVRSYLPAGSVLFCELLDDIPLQAAIAALHGQPLGAESAWGRGRMLAAPADWPATLTP